MLGNATFSLIARFDGIERKPNGHNVKRQENAKNQKIEQLEAKLQQKNNVMAELLEEHIQLKKELGEP